ncbi:hypothetical protein ACWEO1_16800 [Kitasatospora cineracea]
MASTYVVMHRARPVAAGGDLDAAKATAIAADTRHTPAHRLPHVQHRWTETKDTPDVSTLKILNRSTGRWNLTGYRVVKVPATQ